MGPIRHIVILGAGNVATHLSRAFVKKGFTIRQIYNRTEENGQKLARQTGATYIPSPDLMDREADLYVLAVSDGAIPLLAEKLRIETGILVHTSGSVGLDALAPGAGQQGVLYPLQTFRKDRRISFSRIPICVEGNLPGVEKILVNLAGQLSSNVHVVHSGQRKVLHLTAVFAGNFSNFMYSIAEDLLRKHDLSFDLLKPLIRQTATNIDRPELFSQQTGPAIREEMKILEEHLDMLATDVNYQQLYDLISKIIIQQKKQHASL